MMAKRSLQVSRQCIKQVKQVFLRKGWTQEDLANEVGIKTRQPIGRFFAGKPVERRIFIEICFQLDLSWQEIAELPKGVTDESTRKDGDTPYLPVESLISSSALTEVGIKAESDRQYDMDSLVEKVRSHCHDNIQHRCGTLRLLDVAQPIQLEDIYIEVKVLEQPVAQRWLELSELQNVSPEGFNRFGLGRVLQKRVSALEVADQYAKLIVLGKPGSGKTTFLQYLALQCDRGTLQPHRVPLFISLKDFVEDNKGVLSLRDYINQELDSCGIAAEEVKTLLRNGRIMLLLDGLDEVPEAESDAVVQQIRWFSQKYYKNQLAIACRIAAHPYKFNGFTEVEVADFNQQQISTFAKKWFVAVAKENPEEGLAKASQFMTKLAYPENQPIRELAGTPLLLNLTCLVFQTNTDFPHKRSKLYQEGVDILLVKWDASKGIHRNDFYQNLSLADKINLLSFLATNTFERGYYFFEQSKIQQYIADYLSQLPKPKTNLETLLLESESILKSIEAQHGLLVERSRRIYSFSHLTFQEYFTARQMAASQSWQQLTSHITDKRWREVFLMTVGLLRDADPLLQLMKQHIDSLLLGDDKLQQFLRWIDQKSQSSRLECKPAAVRAFFFSLACAFDNYLEFSLRVSNLGWLNLGLLSLSLHYFPLPLYLRFTQILDPAIDLTSDYMLALNFDLTVRSLDYKVDRVLRRFYVFKLALKFALQFDLVLQPNLALNLQRSLEKLQEQLPQAAEDSDEFQEWWKANNLDWTEQLKALVQQHSCKDYTWQFSAEQKQVLMQYYEANKLLVECLKSGCEVSEKLRQQLEDTLLLPLDRQSP